ncbi:MAG TPA: hypothetical protein VMZ53_26620 [Kofleriaceae bacterium]|nr:hypothetical protein [Kofleriaceae bacterium]
MGAVSIGAAVLAAILLLCTYITHPIPRFIGKPLGVHQGDFADRGGLVMTWEAPTVDEDRLRPIEEAMRARNPDGYVWREGRLLKVALAGVPPEQVDAVVARMTKGEGLTFREVLIVPEMKQIGELVPKENFEIDQWRPEDGGPIHTDYYLFAPTLEELDALREDVAAKGVNLPEGAVIAYEKIDSYDGKRGYRTYVVREQPALDGTAIADATLSYDPNTNRPIVLLDFTRDGGRIFGELTSRIVGEKLAALIDGEVRSAPVINGPIRGGRASITMGGADPQQQENEARALVETLKFGNLPAGGHVVEARYQPPTKSPSRLWLARVLLALLAAFVVGGLAYVTLRFARPERQAFAPKRAGAAPWSRLAVMLVAPVAVIGVAQVTMFGVNDVELTHIMARGGRRDFDFVTIGALGIMPVLTAYVVVEAFSLILPTWRRRRNAGPIARQPITLAAAIVSVLLIVFQGWNMAMYMSRIEDVLYPGFFGKLLVVTSVAAGTLILIVAAEVIRWRGLGNGYGALLATGFIGSLIPDDFGPQIAHDDRIVQLLGIAIIAIVFFVGLRWRVSQRGEHSIRFPSSSFAPLAYAGGAVALIGLASQFPVEEFLFKALTWMQRVDSSAMAQLSLVAALAIIWSFAFGRPGPFGGEARPDVITWLRATSLSLVALVLVAAVSVLADSVTEPPPFVSVRTLLVDPIMIAITVAVVMDAIADFRARREKLVVAWTLHEPHHVERVQRLLAANDIQPHMSALHLRSLLSFFGPFAPIEVQVPLAQGEQTREILERLAAEA